MTRRRHALAFVLILALLAAGGAPATRADPPEDGMAALFGGPFELIRHDGGIARDTDFRGRYMLIYFGYAACPAICPTGLAVMAAALEQAGAAGERVQPVFVSVDPVHDTPEVLAKYVGDFHPRLVGLTGNGAAVERAMKAYRIGRHFVPDPDGGPDAYLVNHTPSTFLMGPDGGFRTLFPYGTPAETMAGGITRYVLGSEGGV